MSKSESEYIGISEVSAKYGIKRDVVLSWVTGGLVYAIDVSSANARYKCWRLCKVSLENFLRSRENQKTAVNAVVSAAYSQDSLRTLARKPKKIPRYV